MAKSWGWLRTSHPSSIDLALLASVFIIASCGLVYELVAAALASYVLGDSILQFSTIIGTYLFAMGIGSWISRYIEQHIAAYFVHVEMIIGMVGGLMPLTLFALNSHAPDAFRVALYGGVGVVGMLVGLEIPLVTRLLHERFSIQHLLATVLSFDYLGALAVSLAFPLLCMPYLGLIRTGLFFGLLNMVVALWAVWLFRYQILKWRRYIGLAGVGIGVLFAGFLGADQLSQWTEERLFQDPIILARTSPYQRVVITQNNQGIRLYLNGHLQFAQRDEYRYHEALVHPAMLAQGGARRVAVLGGGDGMAIREILKYPTVESIWLIELDPQITDLFQQHPILIQRNQNALNNPKVHIKNQDAFAFLMETQELFDVIIVDFPDPSNFQLGKLYTNHFYAAMKNALSETGYAVVQTTSPLVARHSFWTVAHTLASTGLWVGPYHVNVPSFGEWGFILASRRGIDPVWLAQDKAALLPKGLRFLHADVLMTLFSFPEDMREVPTEINRLSNQVLVHTFEREWRR